MVGTNYSYVPISTSKKIKWEPKKVSLLGTLTFFGLMIILPILYPFWDFDHDGF